MQEKEVLMSTVIARTWLFRVCSICVLMGLQASATTYKWIGEKYTSFHDPANWTDVDGNAVSVVPTKDDNFYCNGDFIFGLEGQSAAIKNWYVPEDWNNHYLGISNGFFTIYGVVETHTGEMKLSDGASVVFAESSSFSPGINSKGVFSVNINDGCSFLFNGKMKMYNGIFNINDGGVAEFSPVEWGGHQNSAQSLSAINVYEGGHVLFPSGLKWWRGGWDSRFCFNLSVKGGEMSLGGDLRSDNLAYGGITFNVLVEGGKLNILNAAEIVSSSSALSGAVELNVADGVVFDLDDFTVDPESAIVKSGDGTLIVSPENLPGSFEVKGGCLGFYKDRTVVTLPENTVFSGTGAIMLAANNLTLNRDYEGVAFKVDIDRITFDVPVVSADNADLLNRIKSDLTEQLDGNSYTVSINGNSVLISTVSPYTFTGGVSADYSNPENWVCGYVPTNEAIYVRGEMELSGDFPSFASISVENGAKVRVASDVDLPAVAVSLGASFEIEENVNVSLQGISGVATEELLPTLKLSAGATLSVPGNTKFTNMKLLLSEGSTLTGLSDGKLFFGYADAGKIAYFSMCATNATVTALNSTETENGSSINIASPEAGGTVVVCDDIILTGTTFTYNQKDGFAIGFNNPKEQTFKVIADGTDLNYGAETYIAGGANLVMTNGSVLCRKRHREGDDGPTFNLRIQQHGKLTLVDGGELSSGVTRVNHDLVTAVIKLENDDGRVGIEVLDGGIGCWYKLHGSNTGIITFADGIMEVFKNYWWGWGNRCHIFNFLKEVNVADGTTMTIRGVKDKLYTNAPQMGPFMVESPFSGGGDIVVTNTWKNKTIAPVIYSAANTCTGTIKAVECDNSASAKICFSDGANWAGTVVANGKMELVAPVSGSTLDYSSPVTVSFASLELQSDFPVRVWRNESGAITNDLLNVGSYAGSARLVPTLMDAENGDELRDGDRITVGTISAGASLPKFTAGWTARALPHPEIEGVNLLRIVKSSGLVMIVR